MTSTPSSYQVGTIFYVPIGQTTPTFSMSVYSGVNPAADSGPFPAFNYHLRPHALLPGTHPTQPSTVGFDISRPSSSSSSSGVEYPMSAPSAERRHTNDLSSMRQNKRRYSRLEVVPPSEPKKKLASYHLTRIPLMLRYIQDTHPTGIEPKQLRSWIYANLETVNSRTTSSYFSATMLQQAASDGLLTAYGEGSFRSYKLTDKGRDSARDAGEYQPPISPPPAEEREHRPIEECIFSLDSKGRILNNQTDSIVQSTHERGMYSLHACLSKGSFTVKDYESFSGKTLKTADNPKNVMQQLLKFSQEHLGCEQSLFQRHGDRIFLKNQRPDQARVDTASEATQPDSDAELSPLHETKSSSSTRPEPTFTLPVFSNREPASISSSSTQVQSIPQRGDETPSLGVRSPSASQPGGPGFTYRELHDYSAKRDTIRINGGPVVSLVEVSHPDNSRWMVELQTRGEKPDEALLRHFYPQGSVPRGVVQKGVGDTWTYDLPWTDKVSFQAVRES